MKQRNLSIPAARRGAKVAVLSPASYPQPEKLAQGVEALGRLGFLPWVGRHALSKAHHYFAGTAQARLEDLHAAFLDPAVGAIWVAVVAAAVQAFYWHRPSDVLGATLLACACHATATDCASAPRITISRAD